MYRRVPALDSLRSYGVEQARADLVAGLSVAAVAVPQAMAYALIAGLPVEYGLYTAIIMTAVGALLDSSRQLINGPTNAISIALLSAVGAIAAPDERVQAAVLIALLAGTIQLAISLLRLGDLTRYISHSVIVGFTAGASVLLVLDQMKNLLGLQAVGGAHDHFLVRFWLTMTKGGAVHALTFELGLASIALVLALRLVKRLLRLAAPPRVPDRRRRDGRRDGPVRPRAAGREGRRRHPRQPAVARACRTSMPRPSTTSPSSALAIALLGLLEAISMAKAIAAVTGQKLDMNQQCLSEGLANFTGSFFQCMPGSGSLTRSAINQQAGAHTQWSGVVSAAAVALIMMVFAPYARFIPRSALAGILMLTAAPHGEPPGPALPRADVALRRADRRARPRFAAFAISIEFCVLIGVFMSFMLAVPRTGKMLLTEFVVTEDRSVRERQRGDRGLRPHADLRPRRRDVLRLRRQPGAAPRLHRGAHRCRRRRSSCCA